MTPTSERTILEEAAVALRNDALVALLEHTAVLLDLAGEPRARGRGFRAAAVRVGALDVPIASLSAEELQERFGDMNADAWECLSSLVQGRSCGLREELRERFPDSLVDLCTLPGIGPALALRLHDEHAIRSVAALVEADADGRLAKVKGVGAKTREKIVAAAQDYLAAQRERAEAPADQAPAHEPPAHEPPAHEPPAHEPPELALEEAKSAVQAELPLGAEDAEGAPIAVPPAAAEASNADLSERTSEADAEPAVAPAAVPAPQVEPSAPEARPDFAQVLICPACGAAAFELREGALRCRACSRVYGRSDGVFRLYSGGPRRWAVLRSLVDKQLARPQSFVRRLFKPDDALLASLFELLGLADGRQLRVLDASWLGPCATRELVQRQPLDEGAFFVSLGDDLGRLERVARRVAKDGAELAYCVYTDEAGLPFVAGVFDRAVWTAPAKGLSEGAEDLRRVLRSGGQAVVLCGPSGKWARVGERELPLLAASYERTRAAVEAAGFTILSFVSGPRAGLLQVQRD